MTQLPQPATISPGKLNLSYVAGALRHNLSSYIIEGVAIDDASAMRTEAEAMANAWATMMGDTCTIESWRITNLDGVTLHEEALTTPVTGLLVLLPSQSSQSASFSLTGKGNPAFGLKQGQTRTEVFPGVYNDPVFQEPQFPIGPSGLGHIVLNYMNLSNVIGADRYGSKAIYRPYLDTQINAHYQKRYGI